MFDCDAQGLVWIGTDNKGWPPYLTTAASTYQYRISAANLTNVSSITKTINGTAYTVRPTRVRKVFVDTNTDFNFNRRFVGEPYMYGFNNPMRQSNDRIEIAELPVRSEPALENDLPLITFPDDPGAETEIYFVEFFWEPMRLVSESIPVCIPQLFYPALYDYVIGRVSEMDNGQPNDRLMRFYSGIDRGSDWEPSWKEKFQNYMDGGAQPSAGLTEPLF